VPRGREVTGATSDSGQVRRIETVDVHRARARKKGEGKILDERWPCSSGDRKGHEKKAGGTLTEAERGGGGQNLLRRWGSGEGWGDD